MPFDSIYVILFMEMANYRDGYLGEGRGLTSGPEGRFGLVEQFYILIVIVTT